MYRNRIAGLHFNDSNQDGFILVESPPRLRCFGRVTVELNGNQVGNSERVRRFAWDVLELPRCLGCPRNGEQVWAYHEPDGPDMTWSPFCDVTVNSPVHGKTICQVLRARIPALSEYGNIAWGGILIDIFFAQGISAVFSC
jgi:hypothetical protein